MPKKLGRVRHTKTHLDLVILNARKQKRGEIRIKPNRVLWAPAKTKGWYGISLHKFEGLIKTYGKHQKF